MNRFAACVALAAIAICFFVAPVNANPPRTITVTGAGSAAAAPDYVLIKGSVVGGGDNGSEAYTAYRKTRAKLEKDLGPDVFPKLSLRFTGEKIVKAGANPAGAAMALAGGDAVEAGKDFSVTELIECRLQIKSDMERSQIARTLTAVLDRAKKAGVKFETTVNPFAGMIQQPSAVAEFGLSPDGADGKSITLRAFKAAMNDAKSQADQLAELAGGKRGAVVSVRRLENLPSEETNPASALLAIYGMSQRGQTNELTTDKNQMITVHRRIEVVFELAE